MSTFLVSQLLVGVALIFDILSFQFKERKYILHSISAACLFLAIHFVLLDQLTAALLMGVSMLRYYVSGYTTSRNWMYFFLILAVVATIWTFSGLLSCLSFAATTVLTIAAFCKTDKRLREITFVGASLWITHNILAGTPFATVLESVFLMSNIVGYYRFYIRKQVPDSV